MQACVITEQRSSTIGSFFDIISTDFPETSANRSLCETKKVCHPFKEEQKRDIFMCILDANLSLHSYTICIPMRYSWALCSAFIAKLYTFWREIQREVLVMYTELVNWAQMLYPRREVFISVVQRNRINERSVQTMSRLYPKSDWLAKTKNLLALESLDDPHATLLRVCVCLAQPTYFPCQLPPSDYQYVV